MNKERILLGLALLITGPGFNLILQLLHRMGILKNELVFLHLTATIDGSILFLAGEIFQGTALFFDSCFDGLEKANVHIPETFLCLT
jgi:hypothetical protein